MNCPYIVDLTDSRLDVAESGRHGCLPYRTTRQYQRAPARHTAWLASLWLQRNRYARRMHRVPTAWPSGSPQSSRRSHAELHNGSMMSGFLGSFLDRHGDVHRTNRLARLLHEAAGQPDGKQQSNSTYGIKGRRRASIFAPAKILYWRLMEAPVQRETQ
jgi:hypothetical protein